MNNDTAVLNGGIVDAPLFENLKASFAGELLLNGDVGYDEARKIWNGMIDRKPAVIARCKSKEDVVSAVNFARENNLIVSIKGGGHNVTGNAVCDGGIMVDFSLMRSVKVDASRRLAVVEPGATWGDFDKATQAFGLAAPGGLVSTTGVAGLTLGGGVGWLVRKHGLSCDNLVEAEIVLADGRQLTVNTASNQELLWGLRGGGGNFGIVTSFTFRLHPLGKVVGGMILHPREQARQVLQFYREFMNTAPDDLTLYTSLLTSPEGIPLIAFAGCYSGDPGKAEEVLAPLRNFGSPVADLFQPIDFVALQTLLDAAFPHGNRYYWKSCFLKELPDQAIDEIIAAAGLVPSPLSAVILEYYGGASIHEPEGGSAFPHREPAFDLVIVSNWIDNGDDENNINWTRKFFQDMEPFSSHKVSVNFLGVEGEERVKEAYEESYQRLAALKSKYDPGNLFRMNQNIAPAGG